MTYIDYAFFTDNGGSSEISAAAFPPLEYRARKTIDRLTQARVQRMAEVSEAVKMLMVELVNIESKGGSHSVLAPAVSSFSNDGYSETYAESVTQERIEAAQTVLVRQYLSGECDDNDTPLLWLGVDHASLR